MEVTLLGMIPDVEKIIAASSRATRSEPADILLKKMNVEMARKFNQKLMAQGHEGISEFAFFIFSVKNVSRVLTHQLVRHRIASYLQMSSRHSDLGNAGFIIPPKIENNPVTKKIFQDSVKSIQEVYKKLLELGIELEDARFILPDSVETHIVIGMNARSLNNFFGHRLCGKAQWEIRELAEKMRSLVITETPSFFLVEHRPCIIRGECPQTDPCGFTNTLKFKRERSQYLKGHTDEN